MNRSMRIGIARIGIVAGLGALLLAPAAWADSVVEASREKQITHNDDGSVTIDRSWEKATGSGATASGSSSTTVVRDADGVSRESTGTRTTFGGTTFESQGSSSRTRNEDGSVGFGRGRTVTNTETGASRTKHVWGSRQRSGGGTGSFSRNAEVEHRRADGSVRSRSSEGSGSWQRNDRGGRDVDYRATHRNDRGRSADVHRSGSSWLDGNQRGHSSRVERSGSGRPPKRQRPRLLDP